MRKPMLSIAPIATVAIATLVGCTSSENENHKTLETPKVSQSPVREVVPAQLGETITVDGGQGPLVTFSITDISRTDTCNAGTRIDTPVEGDFLAVDYELESGQTPQSTGFKFTTLDGEGFSQETGPESFCNDGSSINQFRTAEKLRGTYYFDVHPDAAKLKAEPRFGNELNENLPAGWTWEIPG